MSRRLKEEIESRGITRLCHFTPSRNFGHIAAGGSGVLSTKKLKQDERAVLNQTDLERLDGYPDHICCSIEYPNAWYLDRAREKERIFKDWVILLLSPWLMLKEGTLFCPRNAAAKRGCYLEPGVKGFLNMFAPEVPGAYGKTFRRGPNHLSAVATDQQAEVLIPDHIAKDDILGIAVKDEVQVRNEVLRLKLMGVSADAFRFVIAPDLFDKYSLNCLIQSGKRPKEVLFQPGDIDAK
jgi:hypothetical protein